ncbi:MAG: S1/P1 Nuclease [Flavobacteriaceae bacterium CG18_big_fil_WC_8_21_14_2_50_34_36]|nr:S1/P1 nuclease [Flavobacteriia bacterium]PIQ17333.1 MAG: S1/P1 Nuclease [Flavobacteriaceae bacterium CG18_big_fil_WC_8_21_14_2_50_34_36]PIV49334.1 MAG: S1/P1 Nuclease [Flavobacteriaceae bacterium CG02_land_8_20_14_3_00_34_13]PJC08175.1 MAG: S1/P1 Nuclease [Flavobacteriaceae bacterium CG_4_9_14_0_8_um_filter_34_30]
MKNITILLICFALSQFAYSSSEDWGQTGHRVTAEVAAKHLTNKAKKEINKLLNGMSLAVASTFADEIKSDSRYKEFSPWHYVNIPFDKTYAEIKKNEKGDIIIGIEKCVAVLKNKNASTEDKIFYLKMLVHFMGDLHQPMHLGLEEDKGGNDFQVRWFNEGTNLHRVWDSQMIESYAMAYTELSDNLPKISKNEIISMQKGTVLDWVTENRVLTKKVYASTESGEKLGYRYMYDHFNTVKLQLQKGGIRLAKVLNEIFS